MAWRKPTNLREWLWILCRHQKKAFFPAIAVMIVVLIASHQIPRVYKAEAKFQRLNDAALQQMGDRTTQRNLNPIRRALTEDIKGRTAVEQLIEDIGLTRDLPHSPDGTLTREGQMQKMDLVRQLQGRIDVWFAIQSDQFDQIVVSYTDTDRELAPRIVNTVVENYIRKTKQSLDDMLLSSKTFFDQEVARYRQRVSELEAQKLRFEMDHPGLLPEDPANNQQKLVELRSQIAAARQSMKVTEQKHASLSAWVQTQPQFTEHERMGTNPVLTDLLARLNALETELDEHLNKWGRTEDHPLVIKTHQRIAELHARIEATPKEAIVGRDRIPNQSRLQAEQQIQMLAGEQTALERQIEELQTQLEQYEILNRNYFVVRNDYLKLQREYEEATNQLQFWETNLRQTTIALRAEIGQRGVRLSIIQRAPDQARPSEPTLPTILFAALALGLGTGGLIVFVAEVIDRSFRSVEHAVDDLKLPVLGTVNEILTEQQILKRKVWNWGVYPSLATVMTVVLLISLSLAYLSLKEPLQFEQLMRSPGGFFTQQTGGG